MQQERRVEPPDRGRGNSVGSALGARPQSARSRSRGRGGNPSELLARRQQLLAGEPNWQDGGEIDLRPDHSIANNPNGDTNAETSNVEAKLESLGELLKAHNNSNSGHNHETNTSSTPSSAKSIDDVYILLAKKEKDLQLAAELGKVLLEKNDELSKANERITEDYSHKLELLEQDKHKLKRQLDQLDGEYENRLIELQTDCNILKNQLDEQQQLARKTEKEKSKLIDDLVQQNQRLTSELVEATKSEELLSSQLEQMNEHFNVRLSNRQDHVVQLEALKEEIQIVNQRKQDLERRLKLAQQDKGKLSVGLEESGDKILMLENLLNDKEAKLGELVEEVQELRDASSWLSNELEAMLALNERLCGQQSDAAGTGNGNQLSNDTNSHLLEEFGSQRKRSQLIEQLKELRLRNRSRLKANEFRLMNQRQVNGAQLRAQQLAGRRSRRGQSRRRRGNRSSLYDELDSEGDLDDEEEDEDSGNSVDEANEESPPSKRDLTLDWSSAELAGEIYAMLRKFHTQLQQRRDLLQQTSTASTTNSANAHLYSPLNSTADDSGISADDMDNGSSQQQTNGKLAVTDPAGWGKLLASLKSLIEELPCSSCQLLIGERADYEQLQKVHARLCDEMRRKSDELLALNMVKTEQETRVAALEERCAILAKDLSDCDKPKEEIVKLAWKARDEAVERKNNAEISLAKTRIENMQISSQLMEVVQQKGELSQKLAQFEDDIHYITQDSVKAKFTWEEYAEKLRRSKATPSDSTGFNSNPLAQLLSFSSVVASTTTRANTANGQQTGTSNNNDNISNGKTNNKSSALDNVSQAGGVGGGGGGLMRNFTSNRFNLRFWTRNSSNGSSEKQVGTEPTTTTTTATDKGGNLSVTNNFTANELTRAS